MIKAKEFWIETRREQNEQKLNLLSKNGWDRNGSTGGSELKTNTGQNNSRGLNSISLLGDSGDIKVWTAVVYTVLLLNDPSSEKGAGQNCTTVLVCTGPSRCCFLKGDDFADNATAVLCCNNKVDTLEERCEDQRKYCTFFLANP